MTSTDQDLRDFDRFSDVHGGTWVFFGGCHILRLTGDMTIHLIGNSELKENGYTVWLCHGLSRYAGIVVTIVGE